MHWCRHICLYWLQCHDLGLCRSPFSTLCAKALVWWLKCSVFHTLHVIFIRGFEKEKIVYFIVFKVQNYTLMLPFSLILTAVPRFGIMWNFTLSAKAIVWWLKCSVFQTLHMIFIKVFEKEKSIFCSIQSAELYTGFAIFIDIDCSAMIWDYVDLHIVCKGNFWWLKCSVFHTLHVIFIKGFEKEKIVYFILFKVQN